MTESEIPVAGQQVRPYGPLGLLVSVVVIALLAATIFAAAGVVIALPYALVSGVDNLADLLDRAGEMVDISGDGAMSLSLMVLGGGFYLAFIAAIWVAAFWRGRAGWRGLLGWSLFRADGIYWSCVAAAVGYGLLAGWLVTKVHPAAKNWLQLPKGAAGILAAFVLIVVLAPLAEELFFRGWLFTSLRSRLSALLTIMVSGVLFACAHWESTHLYALAVLPVGLLLGYLRERQGSVLATALLHAIYNGAGFFAKLLVGD